MYAQIIIDISHEKLDKPFSYRIPVQMEGKVVPGSKVVIPFRNREIYGYVVELSDTIDFEESKVKDIICRSEFDKNHIGKQSHKVETLIFTRDDLLKTVTITGIGNYTDSKEYAFTINAFPL